MSEEHYPDLQEKISNGHYLMPQEKMSNGHYLMPQEKMSNGHYLVPQEKMSNGHYLEPLEKMSNGHYLEPLENIFKKEYKVDRKETKENRRSNLQKITANAILLVALMICISVFINVTVAFKNIPTENEQNEATFFSLCMDCLGLMKSYNLPVQHSNIKSLMKETENGGFQCCAKTPEQIPALLDIIANGQDEMPDVPMGLTSASVSAHKHVISSENTKNSKNTLFESVLKFATNESINHNDHMKGITILDDGLKILYSGYYFVYSSVSCIANNTSDKNLIIYVHRTSQNSPSDNGVLLQAVQKRCDGCHQDFKTVYIGGVFHLKAGDCIQVFVNKKDLVRFTQGSTFLGMVLLGNS